MAPEADAFDQASHEDIGADLLKRPGCRAMQLQERLDPVAGLGRELGTLQGGLQRRDHVELAPPGDRGAAREVDGPKLDRRPGQGPDDGRRVGRVGQHPQPGEDVANLGPLEERRVAGEAEGDAALLERRGDEPRLAPTGAHDHAHGVGAHLARGEQVLDLARGGLGLGALTGGPPEANNRIAINVRAPGPVAVFREPAHRRRGAVDRPSEAKRVIENHVLGTRMALHEGRAGVACRHRRTANRLARIARADEVPVLRGERLDQRAV